MQLMPNSAWRFSLINFIIGIAIALILSVLFVLGMRIMVPYPEYPQYPSRPAANCASSANPDQCYQEQQLTYQKQTEQYQQLRKEYSGKIFVVANVTGLVVLLVGVLGFILGFGTNIGAGIILAGAFGIGFGYVWGWEGADDVTKFLVGLVVAAIVIAGGAMVNRFRHKTLQTPAPPPAMQ